MFWKNWPYWLKGGFTGLLIGIILFLFFIIKIGGDSSHLFSNLNFWIVLLGFIPLTFLGYETCFMSGNPNCRQDIPDYFAYLGLIILMILVFLLGAMAGAIYGKIKNKN